MDFMDFISINHKSWMLYYVFDNESCYFMTHFVLIIYNRSFVFSQDGYGFWENHHDINMEYKYLVASH